jgi:hypothetical protein
MTTKTKTTKQDIVKIYSIYISWYTIDIYTHTHTHTHTHDMIHKHDEYNSCSHL